MPRGLNQQCLQKPHLRHCVFQTQVPHNANNHYQRCSHIGSRQTCRCHCWRCSQKQDHWRCNHTTYGHLLPRSIGRIQCRISSKGAPQNCLDPIHAIQRRASLITKGGQWSIDGWDRGCRYQINGCPVNLPSNNSMFEVTYPSSTSHAANATLVITQD